MVTMDKDLGWSEDILHKLNIRDSFEKKDSNYFKAFSQLGQEVKQNQGNETVNSTKLFEDNEQLRADNESLTNNLNQATISLEKYELKISQLQKTQEQLEKSNRHLNNKVNHLNLEILEKNKSIQIVNDELLLHQIQNNVLNDKITNLQTENERLVVRWIEKVKGDAEKLNDANEFLESVNRK